MSVPRFTAEDVRDMREACNALDRIEQRHGDDFQQAPFDAIKNAQAALRFALDEAEGQA